MNLSGRFILVFIQNYRQGREIMMRKGYLLIGLVFLVMTISSCATSQVNTTNPEKEALSAVPPSDFLSFDQKIVSTHYVDNIEKYELVTGVIKTGEKFEKICFWRTEILDHEEVASAKNRVGEICAVLISRPDLDIPLGNLGKGESWFDAKRKTVSCLVYRKALE